MRAMACFTRARSAVKAVAGAPVPKLATAMRSEGKSRSMKPFAARAMPRAPPNRMFGSSTATTMRRPPVACSLVVKPSGGGGAAGTLAGGVTSDTHSALTTRRGLPSMRTLKSAGVSVVTGLPRSSTTVTSIEVSSTPVWKRGGCGDGCAAEIRLTPDITEEKMPIATSTCARTISGSQR